MAAHRKPRKNLLGLEQTGRHWKQPPTGSTSRGTARWGIAKRIERWAPLAVGAVAFLSLFTLAFIQMDERPKVAAPPSLPDSVAPMALSTSMSTTTTVAPVPVTTVDVPTPTTRAPEPITTTTAVEWTPEPVATSEEPAPVVWTVALAKQAGREIFGDEVFEQCVEPHVQAESGWRWTVYNTGGSGAYGLPQALPGTKMASAGPDWKENPRTQLLWMYNYTRDTYGSACAAWNFFQARGWY